jgi:dihydrofolate reductase
MLSIIVDIAENNAIGLNNQLLWQLSDDLKYFKKTTTGKTVIMGLNTYNSLPFKPLPKRRNIVICDDKNIKIDNVEIAYSIDDAITMTENEDEAFVCGGASIYRQMLPFAQKLYITKVLKSFEADTFFPEIDNKDWILAEESETKIDKKSGLIFKFCIYTRKNEKK